MKTVVVVKAISNLFMNKHAFFFFLQEEEGQQSLECIQANQIFPKKSPVLEEENLQVSQLLTSLHGKNH